MKSKLAYLIVAFSLLLSPSCKKRHSATAACQVTTITGRYHADTSVYQIAYNASGQVSSLQFYTSTTPVDETFNQSGDTLIVMELIGGATYFDTLTLNEDGLVLGNYSSYDTLQNLTTFIYSGTEAQSSLSVFENNSPVTCTYTWNDGDMRVASYSNGLILTYTYNTKPSETGDYWDFSQRLLHGYVSIRTAHQVTSIAYNTGGVETFTYEYDISGRITGLQDSFGAADVDTISYQYTCD